MIPPPAPPPAPAPADPRRALPAVEKLLHALGPDPVLPRPLVVRACRAELASHRTSTPASAPSFASILAAVHTRLARLRHSRLQPVINGTGVVLHTNLGRAPLGRAALEALAALGGHYHNLEFDLTTGRRGARADYLEALLALLAQAEAATVVNNGAAALILALTHLTRHRREVVISRGELIQIGGGFRLPEILETSGAVLREVGTTNHTTLADYARALGPATGLILKVHRSNFFMDGFVASPPINELATLAHRHDLPLIEDLGSGALQPTESLHPDLDHEPTPAESIRHGVDLVTFSGDKLLGGPQAGILAGRRALIDALKAEPLCRALRCDKLVFAALQATAEDHLHGHAADTLPALRALATPLADLQARALTLATALRDLPATVTIGRAESRVGGGSLPRAALPSVTLNVAPTALSPTTLAARLHTAAPPVLGSVSKDHYTLDLRTIFPDQDALLFPALRHALRPGA